MITDLPDEEDSVVEENELQILRQFAPRLLRPTRAARKRHSK